MKPSPSLAEAPMVDDWLSVQSGGDVLVMTGKVEIGQHIGQALAMIVAEELSLPMDKIHVRSADTAHSPNEGYTSGSNSIQHSGEALRAASATARQILICRAAKHFDLDAGSVVLVDGLLRNPAGNETINFAEALAGKPFGVPVDSSATTVTPAKLSVVGHDTIARGLTGIVSGATKFVHDLDWPDMLHARVARPPHYHARLRTTPSTIGAEDEDGKSERTEIICNGSFVAVVGADEYTVVNAASRLQKTLDWDHRGGLDTRAPLAQLYNAPRHSRPVIAGTPDDTPVSPHPEPPADAALTHSARYERAYQMHGSIGPSASAAYFCDGKMTIWSATQGVFPLRGAIAETLGLNPGDVRVIHVPGAGCYGHNGADDASLDAALVARARPQRHILLKWSREQEHAWEPYAPCMGVAMRASLDANGTVMDWCHDVYGDTHRARPRTGAGSIGPSRLLAAQHLANPFPPYVPTPNMARHAGNHRNADPIYAFAQRRITKHLVPNLPLRTSAMRTLGAFANVFAIESFMDELADMAGQDALAFRLRHLAEPRARRVLERVAALAGWHDQECDAGEALGLGMAQYKNAQTYAAVCVRASVDDSAQVQLHHVHVVADAGRVVDPDGLRAQIEGGVIQAASWALFESVQYDEAGITSIDWDSYRIARFSDLPEIEVELIDQPELPSLGAGEASSGPAGAAIANAIARATGVRPRRMPFTPENLRAAAMQS